MTVPAPGLRRRQQTSRGRPQVRDIWTVPQEEQLPSTEFTIAVHVGLSGDDSGPARITEESPIIFLSTAGQQVQTLYLRPAVAGSLQSGLGTTAS